jgi:hypothetical protein
MNNNTDTPIVGILGWEARKNNALSQLGHIPKDMVYETIAGDRWGKGDNLSADFPLSLLS